MEAIDLKVTDAYVMGKPNIPIVELSLASPGDSVAMLFVYDEDRPRCGLRLTIEDMDKLAQEWIKARRVCPFCKEPGMDIVKDGDYLDVHEIGMKCDNCLGETTLQLEADEFSYDRGLT